MTMTPNRLPTSLGESIHRVMAHWIRRAIDTLIGVKQVGSITFPTSVTVEKLATYEDYLRATCSKIWASWKACDLIAQTVLSTPMSVMRNNSVVKNADLDKLMTNPNPWDTWGNLIYKTVLHRRLTGQAFWVKVKSNFTYDKPEQVYIINPKYMRLVIDQQGGLVGYEYRNRGINIAFDAKEVIVFKRPHPNEQWWGLGDVEAGTALFESTINRAKWEEAFWKNGAAPSGLLSFENVVTDSVAWEKTKAEINQKLSGVENSGKLAFLGGGKWTYQQIGLKASDLQDIERTKLNVEQIFQLHGVPLSVAGVRESANYATSEIDEQRFRKYAVLPDVLNITETLTNSLIKGFDPVARLVANITGLINVGQIVQNYGPLFDRGAITINELRVAVGLPEDKENPLYGQAYINSSYIPLELAGIGAPSAESTPPPEATPATRRMAAGLAYA